MNTSEECAFSDTCPGAQPLWVGFNNPRFRYSHHGQIPSDCAYCNGFEPRQPEPEPLKVVKNINWDDWGQMKGDLINLRNKVVELMAKKKEEETFY